MREFPQPHLDHARTRATASVGDTVSHDGALRLVTFATFARQAPDGRSGVLYRLDGDEGETPAEDVTLHACDPEGPPAIGDAVRAPLRRRRGEGPIMDGRIAIAFGDAAHVLFDDGTGRQFEAARGEFTLTARAQAGELATIRARLAARYDAADEEHAYGKIRPAGYHRVTVPYALIGKAKSLGAFWVATHKCWYARPGANMKAFGKAGFAYETLPRGSFLDMAG